MTMTVDVTYTYDDYAEANAAHVAAAGAASRTKRGLLGWVLFVALVVVLFLLLSRQGPRPAPPGRGAGRGAVTPVRPMPAPAPGRTPLLPILLPVVPWLLVFAFIWYFVFRQLRAVSRKPKSSLYAPGSGRPDPDRAPVVGQGTRKILVSAYVAFSLIAAVVLIFRNGTTSDDDLDTTSGRPTLGLVLRIAPWFLIVSAILVLLRRGGIGVRRMWDGQPTLHRPKRIEISDEGVVISDAVMRAEHRWPSLSHARETANLFLLYVSDYGFHMVPKRGFASAEEADGFREIIRRMIVDRPGPAFPVLPLANQPQG